MSLADKARKIPGVAAAEGALTGAVASEHDLPIADYDKQPAEDIAGKLKGFSQRELRMIGAYEAKRENRATIMDKIAKLTGDEPWSGYDEQSVEAITKALSDADAETAREVRSYERDHKDRSGVIRPRTADAPRALDDPRQGVDDVGIEGRLTAVHHDLQRAVARPSASPWTKRPRRPHPSSWPLRSVFIISTGLDVVSRTLSPSCDLRACR